jgi:hypothetical protein
MALAHSKQFQIRADDDFIRRIDEWRRRQPDGIPSRAEAIRTLVDRSLDADKVPQPRKKGARQ